MIANIVADYNFYGNCVVSKLISEHKNATNQRYLFAHAVPSQKLPLGSVDKPETSPRKRQRVARTNRAHNHDAKKMRIMDSETHHMSTDEEQNSLPDHDDMSSEHPSSSLFFDKEIQANLVDERTANIIHEDSWSFADMIAENSLNKTAQVHLSAKAQVHQDSHQASSSKQCISMNLAEILNSNSKSYIFTGIHSLEILDALVECVSDIDVFFKKLRIVLSLKDTIVMTMVKIKMNMDFSALAILFGITRQTCTNYFHCMCVLLATVLKVMIPWPEQEVIRCNLPSSFRKYKKTRIILDYAETPIATCRCLKCWVLTYSQYKKRHTAKYCVGITPSGLITYISSSFGGRASDKLITNQSLILDKLEPNDAVMVDKGFSIENECLERYLKLIRPPFLCQRKKLSRMDALITAEIARARVHVEKVIQRLREYDLLKGPIPWHLVGYFDQCLITAAGLTNSGPPIMNIDKFM